MIHPLDVSYLFQLNFLCFNLYEFNFSFLMEQTMLFKAVFTGSGDSE